MGWWSAKQDKPGVQSYRRPASVKKTPEKLENKQEFDDLGKIEDKEEPFDGVYIQGKHSFKTLFKAIQEQNKDDLMTRNFTKSNFVFIWFNNIGEPDDKSQIVKVLEIAPKVKPPKNTLTDSINCDIDLEEDFMRDEIRLCNEENEEYIENLWIAELSMLQDMLDINKIVQTVWNKPISHKKKGIQASEALLINFINIFRANPAMIKVLFMGKLISLNKEPWILQSGEEVPLNRNKINSISKMLNICSLSLLKRIK